MDEIRKIARACYDGAAGTEKYLAGRLFRSLDVNGDGKISLLEYKKLVHASFSNDDFFKDLDANCDGTLDFHEALALYYMDKVSVPRCSSCNSLLLHSYFSCLPCQTTDVSCYLCCDCYGKGKYEHCHSSNEFIDTRAMLKLLDQMLKQSKLTSQNTHEGMEKLKLGEEDEDEDEDEDDESEDQETDVAKKNGEAAGNEPDRRRGRKRERMAKVIEAMNLAVNLGALVSPAAAMAVAVTTCCIM